MNKYIFVAIGGALGALARFFLKGLHVWEAIYSFPLDTFIINVSGCFVLILFLSLTLELMNINYDLRIGISVGLIGSFTTFSTICKEVYVLISNQDFAVTFIYIFLSVICGLAASYLGYTLSNKIISSKTIKSLR